MSIFQTRCSTSSAVLVTVEERASDAESLIDLIAAKSIGSCPSENENDRIQVADVASEGESEIISFELAVRVRISHLYFSESYSVVDESIEKMKQLRKKTLCSPDSSSTKLEMKMLPAMSQVCFSRKQSEISWICSDSVHSTLEDLLRFTEWQRN